jgi:hypothetical protein
MKKKKVKWHLCFFNWVQHPVGNFRRCKVCDRQQYKVYLDSGILSGWLNMS